MILLMKIVVDMNIVAEITHIYFIFTFFPFFFTLFYYLLFVVFFIIILKAGMILNTYNSKYRNDNRLGLGKNIFSKVNPIIYIYIYIYKV